jgi:hypothetical protein
MRQPTFLDRIDTLIDDLLNDTNLSSSSLASILMAARQAVRDDYHVALARRIWDANNDLRRPKDQDDHAWPCAHSSE